MISFIMAHNSPEITPVTDEQPETPMFIAEKLSHLFAIGAISLEEMWRELELYLDSIRDSERS